MSNNAPYSLLERLQDDEPESVHDKLKPLDLQRHKASVARDLEMLLNTRCPIIHQIDDRFSFCVQSVLTYGIMDLSALSLHDPNDQRRLQDCILKTIEKHEKRLKDVVVYLDFPKEGKQNLRFRVAATLMALPDRPSISFDATMQLSSNTYQIQG